MPLRYDGDSESTGSTMTHNHTAETGDIWHVIGVEPPTSRRGRVTPWVIVLLVLSGLAGVVAFFPFDRTPAIHFKTVPAQRGDLTVTVAATGTLQPVNQVEVGTEISGTVKTVAVDYNDRVTVGQALARLDTAQLDAKFRQTRAALELAQAGVQDAQATVVETRNQFRRSQGLVNRGLTSRDETDRAEAAYTRAQAALAIANAQVTQTRAQLDADRTALEKAVIHAPINGIVLKRQIEPGQTVAASLQTPVLFTLAESLAQMELHVAVDEADVGHIQTGQHGTFTVDAYPKRTFEAVISQVRYAPETVDGVVTYETILTVDNSDLALRPGMTATADITVAHHHDVLQVPNAALRFTPPSVDIESRQQSRNFVSRLLLGSRRRSRDAKQSTAFSRQQQRVWTVKDSEAVAIPVTVGNTDGRMTEVVARDLSPGRPLIVDIEQASK